MSRRVCVFTGTRADYGLLYWPMREIAAAEVLDLQILVSGAHLSPEFGCTYRSIEEDGFVIDERVDMLLSSDSAVAVTKSVGLATIGFADALSRLRPDLLLVLGDRYEALAVAQAALIAGIPIAHLHGGETTEGAIDESIRHAITKMASIHLVAAEPFRRRVIQLGEDPAHVHITGAPGLDNVVRLELLGRDELERELGVTLRPRVILVTYHPVTLAPELQSEAVGALLDALSEFRDTTSIVFTMPNADPDNRAIANRIREFEAGHPDVHAFTSLGHLRYLSLLRAADVVVGNSSSGLIEAPAVQTATVNVGLRQGGRLRGDTVVDCPDGDSAGIAAAIRHALSEEMKARVAGAASLYGDGDSARRIVEILRSTELDGILFKRFGDITY